LRSAAGLSKGHDLSNVRYGLAEFGLEYLLFRRQKPEEAEKPRVRRGLEFDSQVARWVVSWPGAYWRLYREDEAEKKELREAL